MRTVRIFAVAMMLGLAAGCAAPTDDDAEAEGIDESDLKGGFSRLGVDTNGATLDTGHARASGYTFVGRYLSFDGSHPQLTPEETSRLHGGGVAVFAVWELRKERAVETGSVHGQFAAGVADAHAAKDRLAACGGGGKPIYFTVDFDLTESSWDAKRRDKKTGKQIQLGDLVTAYFNGINSVIGVDRTGVYGTYATVKHLFDAGKIKFGWQQTFGGRGKQTDPRAQLRQYDIYPDQTGWGVSGAGALDLDRAVKPDFGQW